MVKRQLEDKIKSQLSKYPVVAVTGPRQSGKTTLLKNILPDYKYVTLENLDTRQFAHEDPLGFLKVHEGKVIFDEVQQAPSLFSYIQGIVDQRGEMGQFVLSGSQNFHLLSRITQSLAGRVALFKLLPFDFKELRDAQLLAPSWREAIIKGFYPAIYDRKLSSSVFYDNYLQTYIDRDLSDLLRIQDLRRFSVFVSLCAGGIGQLLNLNKLAKETAISQPTAKSWLSILERSYIVFLLPPYYENFNKRIRKRPKLYFYDTGLVSFLLGLRSIEDLSDFNQMGNLFENLIIADMMKNNHHQYQLQEYWFWRDAQGLEVDLLTQKAGGLDIFEIKASFTVMSKHFKAMDRFSSLAKKKVKTKTLIYGGDNSYQRSSYQVKSWKG